MSLSLLGNRDFFDLVKAIGESKSKQEEDRIITDEVAYLKKVVPEKGTSKKKLKELVVRSIYVEMLGQDASFIYIKAVELCAATNILHKYAGYLAASLCFSPDNEFRFMLINQIQRDMNSVNQLEACGALFAISKIMTADMIPAVITDVTKLLRHDMDTVRKKAVTALHRLYQIDKSCIVEHLDKVRRMLCDKDPSVMAAALLLLTDLSRDNPPLYKDLVPSLVSILKQIVEHRLPRDFDYHRIPAPWIQMALLKLLAILGRGDQATSEGMYEVLVDVMRRADTGINVGYALVYEAVNAVTTIYPNPLLLDAAATAISRFIRSESHNLKYIGIKGLAIIIKDYPKYAADHQLAVIDCLEDRDETLKRKTLDLLFRMTNSVNVEFIVEKLLMFLKSASDDYFRTDLVSQITQCAERYAPSNSWYVQTVVRVFESAGDKVKASVAHTLLQLIAEGQDNEDDEAEVDEEDPTTELRTGAVEDFLALSDKPHLPDILAQSTAWVLGEYGYLSISHSKEMVIEKLCAIVYKSPNSTTKVYQINAIMKLVAQVGSCPASVLSMINHYKSSISVEVAQRCNEFSALLAASATMAEVLPVDASCEDIDVDMDLNFVNWYVENKLREGCSPYNPPSNFDDDDDDAGKAGSSGFKYTPYEKVTVPINAPSMGLIAVPNPNSNTTTMVTLNAVPISSLGNSGISAGTSSGILTVGGAGNNVLASKGPSQVWSQLMLQPEALPAVAPPPVPVSAPIIQQESPATPSVAAPVATPTAVAAPVVPERPRELTEKEKMAAALFGGMSSSSSSAAKPKRVSLGSRGAASAGPWSASASSTNTPINTTTAATATASTTNILLDTDDDTSAAAEIKSSSGFDLLGDLAMETSTPPVPPPVPQAALASVMGILDLDFLESVPALSNLPFDSLSPSSVPPSVSVAPQAASSSQYNISDAFAHMSVASGNNGAQGSTAPSTGARPLALTTNEFGSRWAKTPAESKIFTPSKVKTLEQLRGAVPSSYAHVESIPQSNEAIFAATSLTGANVLLHIKLSGSRGGADVTVKSASKDICGLELQSIISALGST